MNNALTTMLASMKKSINLHEKNVKFVIGTEIHPIFFIAQ
jgi:hypothetical protein